MPTRRIRDPRSVLRGIWPTLLVVGLTSVASARVAETPAEQHPDRTALRLDYDVYASGLHVMSVTARVDLESAGYRIETDARTGGLIGSLFSWHNGARSEGRFGPAGLVPELHRSDGKWRGRPRRVVLDYGDEGSIAVEVEPDAEEDKREPVPPELVRGTLDPLSAVLAVMKVVASNGSCTATVPVFDGRRRYDLEIRDVGVRTVQPKRYGPFAGPARLCEIRSHMIAGRRIGENEPDRERSADQMLVASVLDGVPPVPVRIDAKAPFGTFVMHLSGVEFMP